MLSLENAASGTNLIEGTHVILLDPVAGTRAKAVAVETQAIGRVHRIGQTKQVSDHYLPSSFRVPHKLFNVYDCN